MVDHLAALIRSQARRIPDKVALRSGGRAMTYAELDRVADAVALRLAAFGVGAASRVVYVDRNSTDFFALLFATAKLGAVLVPLNWRLSGPEVARLVADAGPDVVVLGRDYQDLAGSVGATPVMVDLDPRPTGGVHDWRPGDSDDIAVQMYSSGTTGAAKGVQLTHRNVLAKFRASPGIWGLRPSSVSLVATPLFHIGAAGWALGALFHGATVVLAGGTEPDHLLDVVRRERVTHAFFVPTILGRMPADAACPTLETIVYGASPVDPQVLRRAVAAFDCRFLHAYGLTEAAGQVVSLSPDEHAACLAAGGPMPVGRPDPGVELAVRDIADGTPLPPGKAGEVLIRGPQVMRGYWQRPNETAAVLSADGWLRTGDVGMLDEAGRLHLLDRVKDLIISGGENISPAEIEQVLCDHPGVAEAAVIGIASETWGETPLAYVVPSGVEPVTEDALIAFCRRHLAGFKCPTAVRVVDSLPRNATGKVLKRELRAATDVDNGR